jgi:hypothetical protein
MAVRALMKVVSFRSSRAPGIDPCVKEEIACPRKPVKFAFLIRP